jgi:two-component system response regulator VicR
MMKILLADDEPFMRKLIQRIVEDGGYEFCAATDGMEVFDLVNREHPDLIILDVMMPKMSGFHVCNQLREQGVRVPIIILSAKGDIVDKGVGFSSGADDYLVKPFDPDELLMHIQAHLRQFERVSEFTASSIYEDNIEIDLRRHRVLRDGHEVPFTPKEFEMLSLLALHRGEIVTREQLTHEIWGENYEGEIASVAVFIRKIREKIEDDPSHPLLLRTLRNVGYIFGRD